MDIDRSIYLQMTQLNFFFLLLIRNEKNGYKLSNEYKVVDTQTSVLLCFFVELVYFLPVLSVSIKTDSGQVTVHVEIIR